jgi:hypothetical protein
VTDGGDGADEDRAMVSDAVFTRGSIITSYAHIEYLLADFCLQAWKRSEYTHLRGVFPYKTESRIRAVRKLLESDGPLKLYCEALQPVLDDLLDFEEIRHFVAHGVMVVKATPPTGARIEYQLFRTTKEGPQLGALNTTSAEMEDVGIKISVLLGKLLTTMNRIYDDLDFEMER